MPRANPLKLNPLQLKTLALLQELAKNSATATVDPATGEAFLSTLPSPHGDHFHIGGKLVMGRDASGLANEAVWKALERKGLARASFPLAITLTKEGLAYDTTETQAIFLGTDH
jgi:hypothetical protein